MKLEIKNIDCTDFDLSYLSDEQSDSIQTIVNISIGFTGESEADNFTVYLYTVKWLEKNLFFPKLMNNSIIMRKIDFLELNNYLNSIIAECNNLNFSSREIALKTVAQYFSWEFDNYKE